MSLTVSSGMQRNYTQMLPNIPAVSCIDLFNCSVVLGKERQDPSLDFLCKVRGQKSSKKQSTQQQHALQAPSHAPANSWMTRPHYPVLFKRRPLWLRQATFLRSTTAGDGCKPTADSKLFFIHLPFCHSTKGSGDRVTLLGRSRQSGKCGGGKRRPQQGYLNRPAR